MTALDLELTSDWLARDEAALAPTLSRFFPVVAVAGEGSWLVDVDGRRWLDLTSGIAVTNTGHCHPRVVAAIVEQASQLLHTSVVTHHQRNVELAERIGRLTPWFAEPQVFFCNSGAEAVDGSIKLARLTTGRPGIIAFRGGFHGRTMGGTSLTTSKVKYRQGYEPLLPSVAIAPYATGTAETALAGLDEVFDSQMGGSSVAAMIVEPVLGEGGYVVPPVAWLEGLRARCDEIGALLVFDEVQCGMGRTGRPFAAETFGVRPDVLLFAKGVASGLPLGGIVAERATFAQWPAAAHGSTFGGNPVSCAAAVATIDVLEEGGLWDRAAVVGRRIMSQLREASVGNRAVVDVRGIGLMIGIELVSGEVAGEVQRRCFEAGALVLVCGSHDQVIRLVPPLTISDDEVARGIEILRAALRGVVR